VVPLNDLTDVDTAGVTDGDGLGYQSGAWVPVAFLPLTGGTVAPDANTSVLFAPGDVITHVGDGTAVSTIRSIPTNVTLGAQSATTGPATLGFVLVSSSGSSMVGAVDTAGLFTTVNVSNSQIVVTMPVAGGGGASTVLDLTPNGTAFSTRAGTTPVTIDGSAIVTAASGGGLYDAAGAAAAAQAASQPLDSDLTAIAALTTTSFGRSFLDRADAAAGRTLLGLGTAATSASTDFQPIDSDLTAIAALTTTPFGRALLELADAAAGRTALGLGTAATSAATDFDAAGAATAVANRLSFFTAR
jgi:hypothetical protein